MKNFSAALVVSLFLSLPARADVSPGDLLLPATHSSSAAAITFQGKSDDTYKGKSGCIDGYTIFFLDAARGILGSSFNTSGSGSTIAFNNTGHGVSGPWNVNGSGLATIATGAGVTLGDIQSVTITFSIDPNNATTSGTACSGAAFDSAGDATHYTVTCTGAGCVGAISSTIEVQ